MLQPITTECAFFQLHIEHLLKYKVCSIHMVGNNTSLNKFQSTEIILDLGSDLSGIKS